MKKCNLSIEELKEKILDNLNVSYDEFKEKMMSSFPDELWENCYAISLHRDLYTFLLYKINHLPKSTLQYMQKPDMFEILKVNYYEGNYRPHHTEYSRLLDNYIKNQQKMDMDGEMSWVLEAILQYN